MTSFKSYSPKSSQKLSITTSSLVTLKKFLKLSMMTSFKSYSPKGSQKISITTSYYNYFEELLTTKFTKTNNFFEKLLTKKSAKDLILQFQRKYSVVLRTFW